MPEQFFHPSARVKPLEHANVDMQEMLTQGSSGGFLLRETSLNTPAFSAFSSRKAWEQLGGEGTQRQQCCCTLLGCLDKN
jgi:hypothetical protein